MPRGTEEPTVEMIDGFDPAELEEQDTPAEPEAKADDQPDKDKSKKDDDPVYQELRREIRDLRRENRHMVKTIARPSAAAAPATRKADVEEEDVVLDVDLTELVTNNDGKGLKKVLAKLGVPTRSEVQNMLAEARAEGARGATLAQEYPELVNPKSEFFKTTNAILQDLKVENPGVNEMTLIRLAAKQADAELGGGKPAKRPAAVRRRDEEDLDDDDLDIDAEDDRIRRVGRASADGLRRRPSEGRGGEKSNELSSMQKRIVDNLRAAGSTITYETYAKRAGMGVTMSGMPGRGRR